MITTNYKRAIESGLLPPFAACVAAWKSTPHLAAQLRTVHPSGAALIFAAAYVAGLAGSLSALLIVAAFLVGLAIVRQPAAPIYLRHKGQQPTAPAPTSADGATVKVAPHPLADISGLVVKELKLSQPSANGKPRITTK